MPPRKSNASTNSAEDNADTSTTTPATKAPRESGLGVEDLNLPKTMVQRLAKGVLPPNTQIQKDALLAISKSATVFINYLSAHANEQAQRLNKKTIQPKDVLDAIHDTEFDLFLPRLEAELAKYNAVQCDKRNTYRRKVREEQKAKKGEGDNSVVGREAHSGNGEGEGEAGGNGEESFVTVENGVGERAPKKLRRENGDAEEVGEEEDGADEEDVEDEEIEEEEDDDEGEGEETFEDAREQLVEDPLEERQDEDMEDEVLDGEESD